MEKPPVEPDLVSPWNRNVWLYGLRPPFSLVFVGWITLAQALASRFSLEIYLYTILASFFGLIIGAHYVDIATSKEKFSPFFKIRSREMLAIGASAIAIGSAIGVYMAVRWSILFLVFVAVESFAAFSYPREKPKLAHSYMSFGLTWGTVPFLAAFFIQDGMINLLAVGVSIFVGISVVAMHHLAIMGRESPAWRDALYLLKLYRYSVYSIALLSLAWRLMG
ncbi:MAG: hypothetical protein HYU03_05905 [Thaumarchaeota archaeon]|nr:hypothetical protein [Nitrososphaerota archaeon]